MYYEWRYGLGMMLQCNALNDEWAKWAEEAQWQTGYFGVGSLLVRSIVKARKRRVSPHALLQREPHLH